MLREFLDSPSEEHFTWSATRQVTKPAISDEWAAEEPSAATRTRPYYEDSLTAD